jgi:hypothetical protein
MHQRENTLIDKYRDLRGDYQGLQKSYEKAEEKKAKYKGESQSMQ